MKVESRFKRHLVKKNFTKKIYDISILKLFIQIHFMNFANCTFFLTWDYCIDDYLVKFMNKRVDGVHGSMALSANCNW